MYEKPKQRTYGFTRQWPEPRLKHAYWTARARVRLAQVQFGRFMTPVRCFGAFMLLVASISLLLEYLVKTGNLITLSEAILEYSPGVTLEAISIAITLLVIDALILRGQRDDMRRGLVRDMGGQALDFSLRAVRELREHGWLGDGTLANQFFDDANLQGARLAGADCRQAFFRHANLKQVTFAGANLRHADFYMADMEAAELLRTDLVKSRLDGANLVGANLDEADLRHAGLCEANLADAKAKWAWFDNASLRSALLTSINAPGADFTGADLTDADLHGAQLDHAIFRDANLTGANLTGASLVRVDFNGAQIIGAHFTTADVSDADFAGARIEDCGFWEVIYDDSTKWPAGFEAP